MEMIKPARVRVAPSPTGYTHLATGRVALYNYLLPDRPVVNSFFALRIRIEDAIYPGRKRR